MVSPSAYRWSYQPVNQHVTPSTVLERYGATSDAVAEHLVLDHLVFLEHVALAVFQRLVVRPEKVWHRARTRAINARREAATWSSPFTFTVSQGATVSLSETAS
jgi:hypothetical protein